MKCLQSTCNKFFSVWNTSKAWNLLANIFYLFCGVGDINLSIFLYMWLGHRIVLPFCWIAEVTFFCEVVGDVEQACHLEWESCMLNPNGRTNYFVTFCCSYTNCVSDWALRCVSVCASCINFNMTYPVHNKLWATKLGGANGLLAYLI